LPDAARAFPSIAGSDGLAEAPGAPLSEHDGGDGGLQVSDPPPPGRESPPGAASPAPAPRTRATWPLPAPGTGPPPPPGRSTLFMRFAWMVQPRNYILFACHTSNVAIQSYNLSRWGGVQDWSQGTLHVVKSALPPSLGGPVRGAPAGVAAAKAAPPEAAKVHELGLVAAASSADMTQGRGA